MTGRNRGLPDAGVLLAGVAATLPPMELDEVLRTSELMTRVDRKYVVSAATMAALAASLGEEFAVLRIGRRRRFRYTSTYFDTPDLLTFRHHRQERRRRFKVRIRTYLDGGGRWLEVKLNGGRGTTGKHRIPYEGGIEGPTPPNVPRTGPLTAEAMAFVTYTLRTGLGLTPPAVLEPVLATDYHRVTLIDKASSARLTCDTGLVCRDGRHTRAARPDRVLLESKSATGMATADRLLRDMGIRPVSVSKYCLGVAVLKQQPANRWHRVLRRCFDT